MKITIATGPIFPVPAVRGGAVQRLWEGLAREFAKRGHEVTIFAREFPGQAKDETVDGIRYVRWGGYAQSTSIKRDLVMCLLYTLRAARHVPKGDVVVTNDFWMPVVLPWLSGKAGKVVVNANRFPKKQYRLYGKAAAFAAASSAVADAIERESPACRAKTEVLPNAVDSAFLASISTVQKRATVQILYVGRIHPEKGLRLLADALRGLQRAIERKDQETKGPRDERTDWECVLVGPVAQAEGGGGEEFASELKQKLEGLPVRFEPPVYNTVALADIYDAGDVLVYPSVADTGEAMPLAPLEGMARGLVPVVSDIPAFREYLEPGKNGVVFNHRPEDAAEHLAAALAELVEDANMRAKLGKAARSTAERFSPAAIADKYLQLFEKVVSGT